MNYLLLFNLIIIIKIEYNNIILIIFNPLLNPRFNKEFNLIMFMDYFIRSMYQHGNFI